ncbi:MAG: cyclic lactone autoinducer peptide [Oscillospiraceae bacterium]|nr:cyclic lactone autoinducer peptide [Oscillospiraceae bacterium]MCL2279733.1 cyclic lactone autoinducer peptide [Oscillospiraceae bacterium]
MKNKIKIAITHILGSVALLSAVLIVNHACPFFIHQEKEPEEVRKLRKF